MKKRSSDQLEGSGVSRIKAECCFSRFALLSGDSPDKLNNKKRYLKINPAVKTQVKCFIFTPANPNILEFYFETGTRSSCCRRIDAHQWVGGAVQMISVQFRPVSAYCSEICGSVRFWTRTARTGSAGPPQSSESHQVRVKAEKKRWFSSRL